MIVALSTITKRVSLRPAVRAGHSPHGRPEERLAKTVVERPSSGGLSGKPPGCETLSHPGIDLRYRILECKLQVTGSILFKAKYVGRAEARREMNAPFDGSSARGCGRDPQPRLGGLKMPDAAQGFRATHRCAGFFPRMAGDCLMDAGQPVHKCAGSGGAWSFADYRCH